MSTISVTNLKHESSGSNNIVLDSSGNATVAGTLANTGNLTITSGNLVLSSGNGIDFSADSSAAGMTSELLDDYEEGTWTPSVGGTATYTAQQGRYTKVGRCVYVTGRLTINVLGTGNSQAILGLPFTALSGEEGGGVIHYFASLNTTSIQPVVGVNGSSTSLQLYSRNVAGGSQSSPALTGNGTDYWFSAFYFVA